MQCDKLETIQHVVKNCKTSPALEDIEIDLKCLMVSFESVIKTRQENKIRMNAQKAVFMEEIQSVRKLVNANLDERKKFERWNRT